MGGSYLGIDAHATTGLELAARSDPALGGYIKEVFQPPKAFADLRMLVRHQGRLRDRRLINIMATLWSRKLEYDPEKVPVSQTTVTSGPPTSGLRAAHRMRSGHGRREPR